MCTCGFYQVWAEELRQQRIFWFSIAMDWLFHLTDPTGYSQKNLLMAIICSSTCGMACDLYFSGSLHGSRTLYPPFPMPPCLWAQCRRDLQPQPHKCRWGRLLSLCSVSAWEVGQWMEEAGEETGGHLAWELALLLQKLNNGKIAKEFWKLHTYLPLGQNH